MSGKRASAFVGFSDPGLKMRGESAAAVQYLVLRDSTNPYLLARVRWPDVAEAISAGQPHWQSDPGLFDLPYDPNSAAVTTAQASSIAAGWGVQLTSDPGDPSSSLIRRMPANWSNLVPAERRAWSLDPDAGRRAAAAPKSRSRIVSRMLGRPRRSSLEQAERMPGLLAANDKGPSAGVGSYPVANGNGSPVTLAAERRRHARVPVHGRALLRSAHKTIFVRLVDVSEGGMHGVVADAQSVLESGAGLEPPLVLQHAVSGSEVSLDVIASVGWHKENGPGTQLGVVFVELNDEQVGRVQRFLRNGAGS